MIMPIMEEMKMPCKLSEILYGPMHTSDGQNRTRLGDCWSFLDLQFPFLRLELLLPPSLYRTEESLKMTTTSLQVEALVEYHVSQEKNWSEMTDFH